MQVSVETTAGLERKLKIIVPAETFEPKITAKLKEAARSLRLPGFRPGKVPVREVTRRFGPSIRAEVLSEVMQESFGDAVVQEELRPAGQPDLSVAEPGLFQRGGFDLEYTATFEVMPEVTLQPLDQLELERWEAELSEDEVDKMVTNLREQRAEWAEVDGASQNSDRLTIAFAGTIDGETFAGGSSDEMPLELGSGAMIEGFESGLEGAEAGSERTLDLRFPDDYQSEEVAGKDVRFEVTVNKVERKELPELGDELYAQFDVTEGGHEAFIAKVKENMARELKRHVDNDLKQQVLDGVAELHDVTLPQALIKNEIDRQRGEMLQQFGMAQTDRPAEEMIPDELFRDRAEQSVKTGLVLSQYVKDHDVTAEAEKVRAMIDELAAGYADPEEVVQFYYSNPEALDRVENMAVEEQVVHQIIEQANVTAVSKTYSEVMAGRPPKTLPEKNEAEGDGASVAEPDAEPDAEKAGE